MSYQGISIKEVMERINNEESGWYLPTIQRPYVWGDRHESEKYISKLFDSILKDYPIGNIIVWNCTTKVPFKEFAKDYINDKPIETTDESLWSKKDKRLVYDGQQRLQTIFSCLRYSINNRVLVYDLLNEDDPDDLDKVGFSFVDKNSDYKLDYGIVKMSELYSIKMDDKASYRRSIIANMPNLESEEKRNKVEDKIDAELDKLFTVFVNRDSKVLSRYELHADFTEDQVNEVFQRINSGGVPLSGADLLFSRIKQYYYDFEENTLRLSKTIKELTNGYEIQHYFILLVLNVIIKGSARIDASKINRVDIDKFHSYFKTLEKVIKDFYQQFIYNIFNINNSSLVVRGNAVIPLIIYAFYMKDKYKVDFKNIESHNLNNMKKYFIISQYNDWTTQRILANNSKLAMDKDFKLDEMIVFANNNNRSEQIKVKTLEYYRKFTLKIILNHRLFTNTETSGRYNPELDHIYPTKLDQPPIGYNVDTLWNLQPIDGITNLDKSNKDPKEYFENKPHIKNNYDYIENLIIGSLDWIDFIKDRKQQMIQKFEKDYDILVIDESSNELDVIELNINELKIIDEKLTNFKKVYPNDRAIYLSLNNSKQYVYISKLDDMYRVGIWFPGSKTKIEDLKYEIVNSIRNVNWFTEYKSAITVDYLFKGLEQKEEARSKAIETVKKIVSIVDNKI
jgi:hypothetical protein